SVVEVIDPAALDEAELRRLAAVLAAALDGMGRALHRLAGKPLRARVAAELLELSDSDLSGRSPEGAPMVYITHDELATAVGSVRETVTKVVGELVRLGAIRAGYGKITVRDERVLREVAGEWPTEHRPDAEAEHARLVPLAEGVVEPHRGQRQHAEAEFDLHAHARRREQRRLVRQEPRHRRGPAEVDERHGDHRL